MQKRISVSGGAGNANAVSLLRLMKLYDKDIEYFLKPDKRPSQKSVPHAGGDTVLQKVLAEAFEGSCLVHHSYPIVIKGESYRVRDT